MNPTRFRRAEIGRQLEDFIRYAELKQLVNNIASLQQQNRFRTLAVLSFFPEEGKTLCCAALSRAYSETYQSRVLAIDSRTFRNPRSLTLKECLESAPLTDFLSLDDYKKYAHQIRAASPYSSVQQLSQTPEVVHDRSVSFPARNAGDEFLLQTAIEEYADPYHLILVDTVPLTSKNKGNIDPLLMARKSDASLLVVSRRLLSASSPSAHFKILEDPSIHLIGIIANEEFAK